jgi:hypothetical protein
VSSITIVSDAPNCGITYDRHYDDRNSFIIQATDQFRTIIHRLVELKFILQSEASRSAHFRYTEGLFGTIRKGCNSEACFHGASRTKKKYFLTFLLGVYHSTSCGLGKYNSLKRPFRRFLFKIFNSTNYSKDLCCCFQPLLQLVELYS